MSKRATIHLTIQIDLRHPSSTDGAGPPAPPLRHHVSDLDRVSQLLMSRLARSSSRGRSPLAAKSNRRRMWPPVSVHAGQALRTSRYRFYPRAHRAS